MVNGLDIELLDNFVRCREFCSGWWFTLHGLGDEQVATLGIRLWRHIFCEIERYWNSTVINGSFCMV